MVIADIRHPIPEDKDLKELFEKKKELEEKFHEGGLMDKIKIEPEIIKINYKIAKTSVKPLN